MQGRAGRRHRQDVGRILFVRRHHGRDDLRVLLVAVREQRPEGPIHDARREDLVVAQAAFALEESARDLARSVRLFDVVTAQREKVESRALFGRDRGHEHDALAIGGEDGAVSQLGETTSFKSERTPTDHDGFTYEHIAPSKRDSR